MSDQYSEHSVHGLLPLLIDQETGTLRFSRIGVDRPEDSVLSPDQLPDALIDLFVFHQGSDLEAWASGIREVAPNSIDLVVPDVKWPTFALLVRHDRARREGETLNDVIGLRLERGMAKSASVRKVGSELRKREQSIFAEREAERAFRKGWVGEIKFLRAQNGVDDIGRDGDHLRFTMSKNGMKGVGSGFSIDRLEDRYRVSWQWTAFADRDLEASLEGALLEMGVVRFGQTLAIDVDGLDEASMKEIERIRQAADLEAGRTIDVQRGRTLANRYFSDQILMNMVSSVVKGFPIVADRDFHGGLQFSVGQLAPAMVSKSYLRQAVDFGLLQHSPVAEDEGILVFGATQLGVDLALRRRDAVAANALQTRKSAIARRGGSDASSVVDVSELRAILPPAARRVIEENFLEVEGSASTRAGQIKALVTRLTAEAMGIPLELGDATDVGGMVPR